jgi:hypothetical protein
VGKVLSRAVRPIAYGKALPKQRVDDLAALFPAAVFALTGGLSDRTVIGWGTLLASQTMMSLPLVWQPFLSFYRTCLRPVPPWP